MGPHRVVLSNDTPIGMVGSVVIGDAATVYAGIIESHYRNTLVLDLMRCELNNSLLEAGAPNIYMKTRNKAVNLYTQKFYGFKNIYNERVYERK
ncbi:hypothetical protein A2803_02885 [Candidatus Woesebacteria bacterium RIFCSPHIGHO2_01_FULL_44_21]|uniref:N-acetyltransferase domain-containing protein n=1 Tax=Candidatus Woesebacteria bacterium RIFCSPHIGHO2_01_FULL_44_21 TaxID=1802503 RepID=A0A1F7Z0I0_9BACT|nr:MAG: hypothetical protein A2803_02885 [Candidatus Woesebacteria bacterium RIFCSPHIGHO2_01_FULL_44_21]OGM69240.1 MAG: hypothetical protein A2897_04495 [Candidatus Woesebacteria bacterium RIFCSPLOWO2_01_FULL_44_24b]